MSSDVKQIGLIDVDGHNFPNLALMKISAFHKSQGDNVDFPIFGFNSEWISIYKDETVVSPEIVFDKRHAQMLWNEEI